MNTYNKYLPSLKDEEGPPTKLVCGNELYTQLEVCNIILTNLQFNFASSYWAVKGTKHVPIYVKTLKADLQLIKTAYSITAKLAQQVKQNAKGTLLIAPEKGNDSKKRKLTDRFPWKTKLKASGGKPEYGSDKQQIT